MPAKFAYILLPLAIIMAGSACAMNLPMNEMVDCRVVGGGKLPADSGGPAALCAAIARVATTKAPHIRFKVEVQVQGPSAMTAILTTADGMTLPEQHFSISDQGLTKGSIDRFASSLVDQIARTASR